MLTNHSHKTPTKKTSIYPPNQGQSKERFPPIKVNKDPQINVKIAEIKGRRKMRKMNFKELSSRPYQNLKI